MLSMTPATASTPTSLVTINRMTCEYLDNPSGIDVTNPRLSWIDQSNETGYLQRAYRIAVASSPAKLRQDVGDLWDTGKVDSGDTTLIAYKGIPLKSRMQCWWAVQVWDTHG